MRLTIAEEREKAERTAERVGKVVIVLAAGVFILVGAMMLREHVGEVVSRISALLNAAGR